MRSKKSHLRNYALLGILALNVFALMINLGSVYGEETKGFTADLLRGLGISPESKLDQETSVPRLTSDSLASFSERDQSKSVISPRIVESYSLPSWGGVGFTFRKNITIDSTKVPGNLNDFPVLINLDGDTDLFGVQQSSGNDIMFTDDQGIKLDHEIEKFDQTIPQLVAWVKTDLSGSVNTIISMYFGNSTVSNQQNPSGVWSSNYRAVIHLNDDPTGTIYDSSSGNNDGASSGTMTTTDQVVGKIDGSVEFDGTDDLINIGDVNSNIWSGITVQAWIYHDVTGDDRIICKSYNGTVVNHIISLGVVTSGSDDRLRVRLATDGNGGSVAASLDSATTFTTATWHHVAFTWDSTSEKVYLYIDGTQDSNDYLKDGDTIDDSSLPVILANVNAGTDNRYYQGKIDEARLSNVARSANWIQTEYNNQYQPSSFYAIGEIEGGSNELIEDFIDIQSNVDFSSDTGTHNVFADLLATDSTFNNMTETAGGGASIIRGNTAQGQGGTNTLTVSHSLAYPSGNNRLVIAAAGYESSVSGSIDSITYNGQPMIEIAELPAGASYYARLALYYILDSNLPSSTGSYNVVVTCSDDPSNDIWLSVVGYINVDQSTPDDSDSDAIELTVTTAHTLQSDMTATEDGSLLVQAAFVGNIGTYSPQAGTTEVLTDEDTLSSAAVLNEKLGQGAGSVSIGTTHSSMNRGVWLAACFAPVSSSNYHLDQEMQFTGVYDSPTVIEELRIKTGTFGGSENLEVSFWDGDSWEKISSALTASSWNNYSVLLSGPTYTIRFRGTTTTSDSSQDWWEIDSILLMVESHEETLGRDYGFVWLDSPDEVDLGTTYSSWVQQDLSADSVPENATGVIIAWAENSLTDYHAVARGSQDTNDYMSGGSTYCKIEDETWKMQVVKLTEHRYIDTWRESSSTKLYVMGYTLGSDPQFRRVASDLGDLTADSSWNKITVTGVNAGTTGVILFAQSLSGVDASILVRAVDSTDNMIGREWEEYNSGAFFVKIDSNDQFEYAISNGASAKIFLIAEVKSSIDWLETNRVSISATSAGQWTTRDLDDSLLTVPSTTSGVILQHESTGGYGDYKNIAREYGRSWTFPSYDVGGDQWLMGGSGIDAGNQIQIYAENLEQDVYIHALTLYNDNTAPNVTYFGFDDPGTGAVTFWANIADQSEIENVTITIDEIDYLMSNNGSFWTKNFEVDWKGNYTYQITNTSDIHGNVITTPSEERNHIFSYDTINPTINNFGYSQGIDGTWDNQNNTFFANVSDSWGEIDTVLLEVTTQSLVAVMVEYQNISGFLIFINNTLDLLNGDFDFRIIVNDTKGNQDNSSDSGSVFYNHPPQAQNLLLSPSSPLSNETSFHLEWDYSDQDSGITSESGTEIKWYRNTGSGFFLHSTVYFVYTAIPVWPEIESTNLLKGDEWYASIRPKDGDLFGQVYISSTVTILNTPPIITSVDISPSSAHTTNDLVASWQSSDSDSDSLQYNIIWYLNGGYYTNWSTSATTATLNSGNTTKNQDWSFTVQANDGANFSSVKSLGMNITIANSRPFALNANFTDIEPTNDTDLEISYTFYDPDDDDENISELAVIWYKNWVYQEQFDDFEKIFSNETNNGEIWTFFISVSDNESLASGNIPSITGASIGGGFSNTEPSAVNLTLTPLTPTTTNILTAGFLFSDVDTGQTQTLYDINWYMNSVLQTAPSDDNSISIPASATSRGQQWYFTVKVFDGLAWGLINTSDTITIVNSLPTVSSASFAETDVRTVDNLTIEYTYNDDDGDNVRVFDVRWYHSADGGVSYTLNSSYNNFTSLPYFATAKNDWWNYSIQLTDEYNESNWKFSDPIEIMNSLPWIDPYSIVLTGGFTTSDWLNLTYSWFDDDYPIDIDTGTKITWESSDFEIVPNNLIFLNSTYTKAGQKWWVKITPNDGDQDGESITSWYYFSYVIIGNTPPEITDNEIKIQGKDPTNGSYVDGVAFGTDYDLVVRYNVTDIDGLQGVTDYDILLSGGYALFSDYQWFRNRSGVITLISALDGKTEVPSSYTEKGDIWWVRIRPRDKQEDFGTAKYSPYILITNTAPFLTSFSWDKTSFYSEDDLSFKYGFGDSDLSDIETDLIVEWYLEGVNQTSFYNFVSIPSQNMTKGETWSVRIKVSDGHLYSSWYYLENVTLLNTIPVVSNVLLTPIFPTSNQNLTISWVYFDYDNDSEQSIRIRWYNNSVLQSSLNDLDTVDASHLTRGEEWFVTIEVFDGEHYSLIVASSAITIQNSPPVLTNVVLWNNNDSSNTVYSDGSILIPFVNFTDVDNDLLDDNLMITRWYRNGVHQELFDDQTGISSIELQKGDSWSVIVQIIDVNGAVWSNNLESQVINVINKAPEVISLIFQEELNYLIEDENITIVLTIFDPDLSDNDSSLLVWEVNGAVRPQYTNQTVIPFSATTPGDIWKIIVTPSDGYNTGIQVNRSILIESRPHIQNLTVIIEEDLDGHFTFGLQVLDPRNTIDLVQYRLFLNGSAEPEITVTLNSANATGYWILEYLVSDPSYYNTEALLEILATSELDITAIRTFNFTIVDRVAPRVSATGLGVWFVKNSNDPTHLSFFADIEEHGAGVANITLYYYYSPYVDGEGSATAQDFTPILMIFNGSDGSTLTYAITVPYPLDDEDYEVLYYVSTQDMEGNSDPVAFDIGDHPDRNEPILNPTAGGLPEEVLLIAGLAVFLIFMGSVVYVRFIRKPEIVGLDKGLVMKGVADVNDEEVIAGVDRHTLGLVVSFFDQLHGPIPIIVIPEMLKDNYSKLVALSDRSFSGTGFSDDYKSEVPSSYDFVLAEQLRISVMSYGFALEKVDARGGQENLTLNILVHKDIFKLIEQFKDEIQVKVHEFHMTMSKDSGNKVLIRVKANEVRKYVSAIVLSYVNVYGTTELIDEEKE